MANRQDGPHAHCTVFHPTYKWLFVPDLGDNCIYQYAYDAATGSLKEEGHVPLSAGYGPRHFVFHPTLPVAYSGCELRSHVQVGGPVLRAYGLLLGGRVNAASVWWGWGGGG